MKGLFIRSFYNKEKIVIFYIDNNNNITQRFIKVLKVSENTINAYCYYRKRARTFKIKNILSAGRVKERVTA